MFIFTNNLEPKIIESLQKYFYDNYGTKSPVIERAGDNIATNPDYVDLDLIDLSKYITNVVLALFKSGLEIHGSRTKSKVVPIEIESFEDLEKLLKDILKPQVQEAVNKGRENMIKDRAEELLNMPVKEFDKVIKALNNKTEGATYLDFLALNYLQENNLL